MVANKLNYSRAAVFAAFKLVRSSMAEAGRESNERVGPQQLSLFNNRESDYTDALERRLFRDTAHTAGTSNKRFPE
jgi:hypothetical protein